MPVQDVSFRSALPFRCVGFVVLQLLASILSGCVSEPTFQSQPVDLNPTRYDADPVVERIMNPRSQALHAGDMIWILTDDGKGRISFFQSRTNGTISLKEVGFFASKVDIPTKDIVFLVRYVPWSGKTIHNFYPVVDEIDPGDVGLSCTELGRAILHTDVLRKYINQNGPKDSWGPFVFATPLELRTAESYSTGAEAMFAARSAATARLIHLLRLWQAKGCASATIGKGEATIEQILVDFETQTLAKEVPGASVYTVDKTIQKDLNRIRK